VVGSPITRRPRARSRLISGGSGATLSGTGQITSLKAELDVLMRAVIAKCGRYRPVGIEYRDYMAYTGLTVRGRFFNAANADLKRNGPLP